jgi:hypothetical protein
MKKLSNMLDQFTLFQDPQSEIADTLILLDSQDHYRKTILNPLLRYFNYFLFTSYFIKFG